MAEMVSSTPGSALFGDEVTFRWTAGSGVARYKLSIGLMTGSIEIYSWSRVDCRPVFPGLGSTARLIWVRLYSLFDGVWQHVDCHRYSRRIPTASRTSSTRRMAWWIAPAAGTYPSTINVKLTWEEERTSPITSYPIPIITGYNDRLWTIRIPSITFR